MEKKYNLKQFIELVKQPAQAWFIDIDRAVRD